MKNEAKILFPVIALFIVGLLIMTELCHPTRQVVLRAVATGELEFSSLTEEQLQVIHLGDTIPFHNGAYTLVKIAKK